ncbi:NAD-dependent epimerase/dehydratase family protein [bacterium]|nr:NAD-dependent epimerase/dehydratase family protein [bacterium]
MGSEICRQLVKFGTRSIIMLEASEFNLYQIDLTLRETGEYRNGVTRIHSYLQSATDRTSVRRIFREHRPDTVLHAAAFKHVPLVEANPVPGIRNNINSLLRDDRTVHRANVPRSRPVHGSAFRQRAREFRECHPEIPGSDPSGWTGDRHPSGRHALLHDGGRGRRTGSASQRDGVGG